MFSKKCEILNILLASLFWSFFVSPHLLFPFCLEMANDVRLGLRSMVRIYNIQIIGLLLKIRIVSLRILLAVLSNMTERKIKANTKIPFLHLWKYARTKWMHEYCFKYQEPGSNVLDHWGDMSILIPCNLDLDLWWSIARHYWLHWIPDEHTACDQILQNIYFTIRGL